MAQTIGEPLGDSGSGGESNVTADGLFALPPDHVVLALRARTGFAHLGWRRPSDRERLQCAALLASERFDRESLTVAESVAAWGPSRSVGTVRSSSLITRVLETDPTKVGGAEAVAAVLAVEELLSVLHATQAGYLARLAEPGVVGDPTELAKAPQDRSVSSDTDPGTTEPAVLHAAFQLATAQLGAVLCVGAGSASRRIADAQDLVFGLPAVHAALLEGRIDPRRAGILLDRSAVLAFDLRTEVADRLLPLASGCTPLRWVTIVDAAVIAADPAGAEARRREAIERRRLRLDRADDGMAKFIAELSAPDAQLAWDLFDAIGRALKGMDDRCIDHRRADAFSTMIELLAAGESVSVAGLIELAVAMDHETCCDTDDAEHVHGQASERADGAAGTGEPDLEDGQADLTEDSLKGGRDEDGDPEQATEPGTTASADDPEDGLNRGGVQEGNAERATAPGTAASADDPEDGLNGGGVQEVAPEQSSAPGTAASADGLGADSGDSRPADDAAPNSTKPAAVEFGDAKTWDPNHHCSTCGSERTTGDGAGWTMPTRQGRRTHATVVLTLETLAAIVNDPAALVGHGVITAELARTLAQAASSVSLLVGDPETGAVLGAGAWKYRPRQEVRDQLVTAYATCIFTGCDRKCDDSDFDHRKNFRHVNPREGGSTTARTMFPLCRLHHRLKTFTAWKYRRNDRTMEFRSPLGLVSSTRQIDPVILHGFRAEGPEPPDTPAPF